MNDINRTNSTISMTEDKDLIVYICIHIVMPCAVAVGIIGNLLSILVFARREMIKFCVSIFTIVLALSDILLLITSLFNIILPDFHGVLFSDKSAFWCHFHGYFDLLFAALSGYSVVFISLERWFSIWKPFDKSKYVTFKTTIMAVVSYTLISIVAFSWFPLILDYNIKNTESNEICQLKQRTIYKIFGTLSIIFTYILPFIFLGILNTLIVARLHARHNTSIQRGAASPINSNANSSLGQVSTRQRLRHKNADRNITFMLIAVAIAFMVMSFPYQIYWFYLEIQKQQNQNKTLFTLTQTFRYLNCCCNFFLYSATSSLFRRQLREIFQCSNSLINHQKGIAIGHVSSLNRTGAPPSPPVCAASERKKLLATTSTSIMTSKCEQTKTSENANLKITTNEPVNGHTASFKT